MGKICAILGMLLLEEPLILAFIKANVQQLKYEFVKLVIDWVSENKFLDS